MPHSMTGFSTAEARVGAFRLVWEIRSVNHRFLELGFRLPEDLRAVEPECRELVAAAIKRGKVDCTLKVGADERGAVADTIVAGALERLRALEERVRARVSRGEGADGARGAALARGARGAGRKTSRSSAKPSRPAWA